MYFEHCGRNLSPQNWNLLFVSSPSPCCAVPHKIYIQKLNSAVLVLLTCGNFLCVGPKAQLMLRYPDGKREQVSLPEQAKLLVSGVSGNPCLSRQKMKLENFCAWGDTIEMRSSGRGVSRECLHCVPCHSSLITADSVSPLQLMFCVLSSVFLNPHTAHFLYKITLNGFCINR